MDGLVPGLMACRLDVWLGGLMAWWLRRLCVVASVDDVVGVTGACRFVGLAAVAGGVVYLAVMVVGALALALALALVVLLAVSSQATSSVSAAGPASPPTSAPALVLLAVLTAPLVPWCRWCRS